MKYLVFNVAVLAALGYIFLDGGNVDMKKVTEPVSRTIERITKTEPVIAAPAPKADEGPVRAVREELSEAEKFILYGEKPAATAPEIPPREVVAPKAPKSEVAALQPPPLPAAIEVAKKPALPPVTRNTPLHRPANEVIATGSAIEAVAPSPVDQAERRKNLRRLVADMERVFAEKLTQ